MYIPDTAEKILITIGYDQNGNAYQVSLIDAGMLLIFGENPIEGDLWLNRCVNELTGYVKCGRNIEIRFIIHWQEVLDLSQKNGFTLESRRIVLIANSLKWPERLNFRYLRFLVQCYGLQLLAVFPMKQRKWTRSGINHIPKLIFLPENVPPSSYIPSRHPEQYLHEKSGDILFCHFRHFPESNNAKMLWTEKSVNHVK